MKSAYDRYLHSLCLIPACPLCHLDLSICISGSGCGGHLISLGWRLIMCAAVAVDWPRIFNTLVPLTRQDPLLAVSCGGRQGAHGAHTRAPWGWKGIGCLRKVLRIRVLIKVLMVLLHTQIPIQIIHYLAFKGWRGTLSIFITNCPSWEEIMRHLRLKLSLLVLRDHSTLSLLLDKGLLCRIKLPKVMALPLIRVTRHYWGCHSIILINISLIFPCHSST